MNNKIKSYEEARINIGTGSAEVHISEQSDRTYNIEISEYEKETLRIGIPFPDGKGTLYMYWNEIKNIVMDHEYGDKNKPDPNKKTKKNIF